ncbi:hypothetical protein BJF93_09960 [Xaviernesmea oryzae]|uniref:DUF5680 domain-containing protein n=1 Tax=Xaviernesmea oryzae TaxID=464029 RepID=A0A1Q9AWU1_9HYPH|nr:DUF5680 domain-containing protein [Xaviernesmea oryzae]OLP59917.1 hypothetical protein BJF93_09960 [Xaviernesmea oryzae]SEK45307.1 hypothetical protein SAMN04487976_102221 [Xaviernesmea oryzae]
MDLPAFIVAAKAACYVGGGGSAPSTRPGSHDLGFESGPWRYLDSYFGGTDFLGQECVWFEDKPIWAMNYYGRILLPTLIDGTVAGGIIQTALSALYREGRFLGGFRLAVAPYDYIDESEGDHRSFRGVERIERAGQIAYRLDYHGGMILD